MPRYAATALAALTLAACSGDSASPDRAWAYGVACVDGVSQAQVGHLLAQLVAEGYITPTGPAPTGTRAQAYTLTDMCSRWLAPMDADEEAALIERGNRAADLAIADMRAR